MRRVSTGRQDSRPFELTCTNNSGRRSHRGTVEDQMRINTTSKRFRYMRGKTRTHEDRLGDTQRHPCHHQPDVIMHRRRQSRDHSPSGTSQTDVQGRTGDLADDHVRGDLEPDITDKEDGNDRVVVGRAEGEVVYDSG